MEKDVAAPRARRFGPASALTLASWSRAIAATLAAGRCDEAIAQLGALHSRTA